METFKPVTLVDPNGVEYEARDATEMNSLIFGHGYRPKGKQRIEDLVDAPAKAAAKERS